MRASLQQPLWLIRAHGSLVRVLFIAALVLVIIDIGASLLRGPTQLVTAGAVVPSTRDAGVEGIAMRFARAYLSVDSDADARDRSLSSFGLPAEAAADERPGSEPARVTTTTVIATARRGPRRSVVTVACDIGRHTTYLAVSVSRTQDGRLYVSGPPAIVGPPTIARGQLTSPELEVDDPPLKAVAARALRHYLAGASGDLTADLAPRARVSLPDTSLRVAHIDTTTWAAPGRVAVGLLARGPDGTQLSLRYELDVVRLGGRWLVRSIQVNPLDREDQP